MRCKDDCGRNAWCKIIVYIMKVFRLLQKNESCSIISLGYDVGDCLEALYEALWTWRVFASNVIRY